MPCTSAGYDIDGYYRKEHEENVKKQRKEKEGLVLEKILSDSLFGKDEESRELSRFMIGARFPYHHMALINLETYFVCRRFVAFPAKKVEIDYWADLNEVKKQVDIIVGQKLVDNSIVAAGEKKMNLQFYRNHVMISVFEYLDTKTIVESCLRTCKDWINLILFNEDFASRVVKCRMTKSINKIVGNVNFSFETLQALYRNMTWIEIYIASGIYHIDICEKSVKTLISLPHTILFSLLKFNPLQFFNLSKNHILYKRFNSSKNVAIINDYVNKSCLTGINGFLKCSTDESNTILEMIAIPTVFPINNSLGFSINFQKELKNYLDLLKEITTELSPLINDTLDDIVASSLDNVRTKAERFLERRNPLEDYSLGKDVLLGLHLILLDSFYKEATPVPSLSFARLLETRNKNLQVSEKFYPKKSRFNFYTSLINSLSNKTRNKKRENSPTFKKSLNAIEFLREHIFELSEIGEKLLQEEQYLTETIHKYHEFLQEKQLSTPPKEIDFIFHYHLLHPPNFIQDSKRISGFIKSHNFNFQP